MILGGNILLLETKGRQSGKIRKVPLTYAEIDNGFLVAASYGGRDKTPNWFYNLENSNTFVTVHKDRLKVRTELVQDNELEYFWNKLIAIYQDPNQSIAIRLSALEAVENSKDLNLKIALEEVIQNADFVLDDLMKKFS